MGSFPETLIDPMFHCMKFLSCNMSRTMLSLKVILGKYRGHRDQLVCQVIAYKKLKTMENYSTVSPEMLSQFVTRSGCFQDVPTVRFSLGNFGVF